MLDEGAYATLEDLARAKGVHATYAGLQLDDLVNGFPVDWEGQRPMGVGIGGNQAGP
jgi:hypothetical protein